MTSKTLEFLIKAKDKASAVFKDVSSNLSKVATSAETAGKAMASSMTQAVSKVEAASSAMGKFSTAIATGMTTAMNKVDAAGKSLDKLGDSITGTSMQLSMFGAALTAAAAAPIAIAAGFEKELSNLKAALPDSTVEQMNALAEAAKNMGRETQYTAREAAAALTELAKAGLNVDEAISVLPATLDFAAAGEIALATAAELAVNMTSGLLLPMSEMQRIIDIMAVTADRTTANITDLAEALKYVGSAAASYGMSVEETAAILGVLDNAGMKASVGGNMLKSAMLYLTTETKRTTEALDELGVNIKDGEGNFRNFTDILSDLGAAGMTLPQAAKIFGSSASTAMLVAARASGEIREMSNALRDVDGAARRTASIKMDNLIGDVTTLKSAFESLMITVGTPLINRMRDLVQWVTQIVNKIEDLEKASGGLLSEITFVALGFGALLTVLGALGLVLGGLLSGLGTLLTVFAKLGLALKGVIGFFLNFAAIIGKVQGWVVGAYTAVVAFGTKIYAAFRAVAGAATILWTALRAGTGVLAALRIAMGTLMGPVGWVITGVTALVQAWSWLSDSGDDAVEAVKEQRAGFEEVADALRDVGDASAAVKSTISSALAETAAPIEALKADFKAASDFIKATLDEQIRVIDAATQEETRLLTEGHLSQRELARETSRIAIESERKKSEAIDEASSYMLSVWNRTYGIALEAERQAGVVGSELAQEAVDAKLSIYGQLETAYRATISNLIAEERRHLETVKSLEQERLMLKMSVEDKLRALSQKTMTDEQAYADRVKQIDEKIAKAREAAAAGQTEAMKRYANEAISLAQSNANEVTRTIETGAKKTEQTVVTLNQAVQTSKTQIEAAYKVMDSGINDVISDTKIMAETTGRDIDQQQTKLDTLLEKIEEIRKEQSIKIETSITANEDATKAAIVRMQQLADLQAIQVKMDADLAAANLTLQMWKQDPNNTEFALQAMVAQERLALSIAEMKAAMDAAGMKVPADLDVAPALTAMEDLVEDLNDRETQSEHDVKPDLTKVNAAFAKLNKTVTQSTHIIWEERRPRNANGGPIRGYADGGGVWRRITGAVRGAGTATSDSIRAMLSNGEYVIRARATSLISSLLPGFMEKLNAVSSKRDFEQLLTSVLGGMQSLPVLKRAGGGYVSSDSVSQAAARPGISESLTVTFRAGELEAPVRIIDPASRENMKAFARELQRLQLVTG